MPLVLPLRSSISDLLIFSYQFLFLQARSQKRMVQFTLCVRASIYFTIVKPAAQIFLFSVS